MDYEDPYVQQAKGVVEDEVRVWAGGSASNYERTEMTTIALEKLLIEAFAAIYELKDEVRFLKGRVD